MHRLLTFQIVQSAIFWCTHLITAWSWGHLPCCMWVKISDADDLVFFSYHDALSQKTKVILQLQTDNRISFINIVGQAVNGKIQ